MEVSNMHGGAKTHMRGKRTRADDKDLLQRLGHVATKGRPHDGAACCPQQAKCGHCMHVTYTLSAWFQVRILQ